MRVGAVAARINAKRRNIRKRSPSEEELELIKKQEHEKQKNTVRTKKRNNTYIDPSDFATPYQT